MSTSRDRRLAFGGALLVVLLATGIYLAVIDARDRGRRALEQLQTEQLNQLARGMDARVTAVFTSLTGFVAGPPAWNLTAGDPRDAARLGALQALTPQSRTGMYLVDAGGTLTVGTLLQHGGIGTQPSRPGLADARRATVPGILPVAPGLTTSLPTIAIVFPILGDGGATRGLFVLESDVSTESNFDQEVAALVRGRTGEFSFVDGNGVVLASSRAARLGSRYTPASVLREGPGLHRHGSTIYGVRDVKSAGWRVVFSQQASEFEGGLGRRVQNALLLLLAGAALAATLVFASLVRRLRVAREEQRRLAELNRTTEEFISIVSHELRTPVAGVTGFLQTTLDHWDVMSDDDRLHAVRRAAGNARRLHGLTRDVLDTTALEPGELACDRELLDLRDEVMNTVASAREASPDRTINLTAPASPLWVEADPIRIDQVLVNLIENALRYSPAGTTIDVSVAARPDGASVTVADHGPGLAPDMLERVFDRFVRGRTSGVQGTGLGLYICRRIVEAHGGHMTAAAPLGGGAAFTMVIPSAAPARVS